MAFLDNTSQLGDSMNFPESPSVKKREALSNIIFKITQSTEKQNLRNERLLKLNLDYELRMLQLDQGRVKKISTKLNSEKVYHAKSSKWLFGHGLEESSEIIKVNKFRRRHSMSETVSDFERIRRQAQATEDGVKESGVKSQKEMMKLPKLSPLSNTALDTKNDFDLIRSKTAPEMKYRSKRNTTENYDRFTSATEAKEETRDGTKAEMIESEGRSMNGLLQGSYEIKVRDMQHEGNINKEFLPEIDKDLPHLKSLKKRASGSNLSTNMTTEIGIQNSNVERELRRIEPRESELMKRQSFETRASNLGVEETNFERLMNKARNSTINSLAFEPVDPSYRRSCATRKRYEELEKQRPRILTRFFREKRDFDRSSKSDQERASNKLHSHFGF